MFDQNSSVECVAIEALSSSINDSSVNVSGTRGEIRGANNIYLYWMAGATGCGVIWAIVNTVTLIVLSELIRAHYLVEEKRIKTKTKVTTER